MCKPKAAMPLRWNDKRTRSQISLKPLQHLSIISRQPRIIGEEAAIEVKQLTRRDIQTILAVHPNGQLHRKGQPICILNQQMARLFPIARNPVIGVRSDQHGGLIDLQRAAPLALV